MNIKKAVSSILIASFLALGLVSCRDFFDPETETVVKEADYFQDWNDFRGAEMGLYSLQQELVDQIVILGELRADHIEITDNASQDLVEIYNYEFYENNEYISPANFYKLIANCNNLLRKLKIKKPLLGNLDAITAINNDQNAENNYVYDNYDYLYGSVLTMRAWAYFNAVKIYGEIPYVPEQIVEVEDIETFLKTGKVVITNDKVVYGIDGYWENDTIETDTVVMERMWLNTNAVIDTFTNQLTTKIHSTQNGIYTNYFVGVNYNIDDVNDRTWEIKVWNSYAFHCLLGEMYLTKGDLYRAEEEFSNIVYFNSPTEDNRYMLTQNSSAFRGFYTGVNIMEHILILPFSKSNKQTNSLQYLFDNDGANSYQLKPSDWGVWLFETDWVGWTVDSDDEEIKNPGTPNDYVRGYDLSYNYYMEDTEEDMSAKVCREVLELKRLNKTFEVKNFMDRVDTVVTKFSLGKNSFDHDANYTLYRAGAIHLYMAELMTRSYYPGKPEGVTKTSIAAQILGTGNYTLIGDDESGQYNDASNGVRGRVGRSSSNLEPTELGWIRDPFTNEVIKYVKVNQSASLSNRYFEDFIIDERAREIAYEGDRFYTLMRIAERRNDPEYLAFKVARKFSSNEEKTILTGQLYGDKANRMFEHLKDKNNWYVPFYVGKISDEE